MGKTVDKTSRRSPNNTLPWGVEALEEKSEKEKVEEPRKPLDSLVKSPPPYRQKAGPAKGVPEDISTIYPDDDVDHLADESNDPDDTSVPPGEKKGEPTPETVAKQDEGAEYISMNENTEKKGAEPREERFEDKVSITDSLIPPLDTPSEVDRLRAIHETEDRGKLKFIIGISGVVFVGVVGLIVFFFLIAEDGKINNGPVVPPAPQAPLAPPQLLVKDPAPQAGVSGLASPGAGLAGSPRPASGASDAIVEIQAAPEAEPEESAEAPEAAPEEPAEAPEAAPEPSPVEAPERDEDTVRIRIGGIPQDGEVFINNAPAEPPFIVPKSDKAVKVEVRAPGYVSGVKRVVPNVDKSVHVRMKKK